MVRAQREVGVLAVSSRQNLCVLLLPPSYPAATVFAIRKRSSLLSLCSLLPARKPKCCFFFLRLRKVENPSVFQSVRRTPRRQGGRESEGRDYPLPCHSLSLISIPSASSSLGECTYNGSLPTYFRARTRVNCFMRVGRHVG